MFGVGTQLVHGRRNVLFHNLRHQIGRFGTTARDLAEILRVNILVAFVALVKRKLCYFGVEL